MSRVRRLARSSFATVFAGNVATSALGLVTGLVLAKLLSPTGRGELAIALVWPALGLNFLGLGVRNSTAYFAARYPDRRPEVLRVAVRHAVISTAVIVGLGVVGAFVFVDGSRLRVAMIVAFAGTPFALVTGIARGVLQSVNLRHWSSVRLVQPLTYVVVIVAMALLDRLTVVTGAVAYLASLIGACIAAWVITPTEIGRPAPGCEPLDRPMLGYGLRSTFAQSTQTVNVRLDIAVLGLLLPASDVGIYAVAASLSQYVVPLSTATAPWVFPQIARRTDGVANRASARRAVRVAAGIAVAFAAAGAVIGPVALIRFLGEEWRDSLVPLWILLGGAVFQSIRFVSVSIANALEHPEWTAKSELLAAVSTMVLLWPLVHFFGIIGAAVTTVIAYTISAVYLNALIERSFTTDGESDAGMVVPAVEVDSSP